MRKKKKKKTTYRNISYLKIKKPFHYSYQHKKMQVFFVIYSKACSLIGWQLRMFSIKKSRIQIFLLSL